MNFKAQAASIIDDRTTMKKTSELRDSALDRAVADARPLVSVEDEVGTPAPRAAAQVIGGTTRVATRDLTGPALCWAVAACDAATIGRASIEVNGREFGVQIPGVGFFQPDKVWSFGGPIVDRYGVMFQSAGAGQVDAYLARTGTSGGLWRGDNHLVAAMRCVVASKFGDAVAVPDLLLTHAHGTLVEQMRKYVEAKTQDGDHASDPGAASCPAPAARRPRM